MSGEESTTDILGLHETSKEYQKALGAGLRVVNVPEPGSFFGIWIPDGYDQQGVHLHALWAVLATYLVTWYNCVILIPATDALILAQSVFLNDVLMGDK